MRLWEWVEKNGLSEGTWSCDEERKLIRNDLPSLAVWEHKITHRHEPSGRQFEEVYRLTIDYRRKGFHAEFVDGREL